MPSFSNHTRQVGIIVVTHADYGSALLRAAECIAGPAQDCAFIPVDAAQEVPDTVNRLKEAADRLDAGQGVLVLTDMFGGTPTNLSLSLLGARTDVEVLTGVNLPMLLKVLDNRRLPLAELTEAARVAGCEGIIAAGTVLRSKSASRRENGESAPDSESR